MKILFIAGFGPIITDIDKSRDLYVGALGLPLKEEDNHYFHTGEVDGAKHFALWPLSQAAESCFGMDKWPDDIPAPTSWIEFDVEDIEAATKELEAAGYKLLVAARKEPWEQIVTRFLSPEGILTAVTYTPWMREDEH
jgi:catechol 2,3-dioxygenase-like lactoylglutathione lyase family enzyme